MKLREASEFLEKEGVASARTFLRSAREHAKVSQLELSRLSGVPQPNLNRIESGTQEGFTARTFVRLYNAIEKRLIANHRDARRAERLMQLSQKHGPLPQRELVALLKKEEKAERDEARGKSRQQFAALKSLGPLAEYAALKAVAEGKVSLDGALWQFSPTNLLHSYAMGHTQFHEVLREQEAERKRQLTALENAQSLDDPIVQEVIQLFRDEIERLEKANELLSRELAKANTGSDD